MTSERMVDTQTVYPAGELDIAAVETLQAQARAALAQPGAQTLIFDLTAVTFIDAAAIDALVVIHNCAASHGSTVRVANVSLRILRVLTIAGVADYLGASPSILSGHRSGTL